jgi:hypothetical protein
LEIGDWGHAYSEFLPHKAATDQPSVGARRGLYASNLAPDKHTGGFGSGFFPAMDFLSMNKPSHAGIFSLQILKCKLNNCNH